MTPRTPRSNKIARRNRANRERGVRFERKIRRLFELEGYDARRVLEYDGHRRGQDIALFKDGKELPIIIQCKATKNPRDLSTGLSEALEHNPDGDLFISIWSYNRRQTCLILARAAPVQPEPVSLSEVFKVIATLYPDARGARTVTAASDSFRLHNFLPLTVRRASPPPAAPAAPPSPASAAEPASIEQIKAIQ